MDIVPPASTPDDLPDAEQRIRIPLKPIIVFAVILIGLLVVYLSPLKAYLENIKAVKEQLRALGFWGPAIYMGVVFLLISVGFPRLLFCPIGGMAFGFFEGLLWTQLATLLGYYVLFLFVRWGGRGFVARHWPRLGHIDTLVTRHAIPTVLVIRQTPISGLVINLLLGVSPIRHRHFLLGTALGLLPEAIPFTLVGSSAGKFSSGESWMYMIAGTIALVLVWAGFWFFLRRSKTFAELRGKLVEK